MMKGMIDTILHRWLRVPYTLKVRHIRRPKKPVATLLFLHGLGNTGAVWNGIIKKLPDDVLIVTIDMLGFGESPSPSWAIYNAKTQSRSVLATLFKLRITTPIIVVGHSMGALVAIEMAKRYPLFVEQLVLCSPPLYDDQVAKLPRSDDLLRQLFKAAEKHPDQFLRLASFAMKYRLINDTFNVTQENIGSYMSALGAMIINQTSLQDAYSVRVPMTVIRGTLDPFVVSKNLKKLKRMNDKVTVKTIIAGHEVKGTYTKPVVSTILKQLDSTVHGKSV